MGLVVFGLGFLFLGVALFFDKGLLAMGNVSFVEYVTCACIIQYRKLLIAIVYE